MKYLAVILVLVFAGAAYLRLSQPAIWNNCLRLMLAPTDSGTVATDTSSTQGGPGDDSQIPDPQPHNDVPQIISPDSTNYLNPDHIRPCKQPGETADDPSAKSRTATNSSSAAPSVVNAGQNSK
jgi:hypothetical protein